MSSNNFAELTGKPAQVAVNDYATVFVMLTDDGKQRYESIQGTHSIPTLDVIEDEGVAVTGAQVQSLIDSADESESVWYGNRYDGFYLRHGDKFMSVVAKVRGDEGYDYATLSRLLNAERGDSAVRHGRQYADAAEYPTLTVGTRPDITTPYDGHFEVEYLFNEGETFQNRTIRDFRQNPPVVTTRAV